MFFLQPTMENREHSCSILYKSCFVPKCRNTTFTAPNKHFFSVPRDAKIRQKWFEAIGRYKEAYSFTELLSNCFLNICEDHFDIENDSNILRYRFMEASGYKTDLTLKKGVVPHKFSIYHHHHNSGKTFPQTEEDIDEDHIKESWYTHTVPEYQNRNQDPQVQIKTECQVQNLDLQGDENPSHIDENLNLVLNHPEIDLNQVQNHLHGDQNPCAENPALEYARVIDTEDLLQGHDQDQNAMAEGRPIYRECRACLKIGESAGYVDIFLTKDPPWCWKKETTIAEELARIAHVEVSNADKCSDVVCFSCCIKLHTAAQFVEMVQQSDQIIKARLLDQSTSNSKWPKPIRLDSELSEAVLDNVPEVEIKQEVFSEEEKSLSECIDNGDKPDLHMEIKVEPEEIVQSAQIQVTVNGTVTADQMKDASPGCEIYYNEEYLNDNVKEEPVSDDESGPFDLPLECMLCTKSFSSVSGLKAHVLASHSYKGVSRRLDAPRSTAKRRQRHICSICRRCFWTLTDLMVHETCHNKFHCYGCQMKFESFGELLKHRQRCIASNTQQYQVKTLKDAVRTASTEVYIRKSCVSQIQCTKCNETFTNEYYMNIHNEIHHSSSNSETDIDKVLCKTKANGSIEVDEKGKIKQTDSEDTEEKDEKKETTSIEAKEKDNRNETTSKCSDEKYKSMKTTSVDADDKIQRMESTSVDTEDKVERMEITSEDTDDNVERVESASVDADDKVERMDSTSVDTDEKVERMESTSVDADGKVERMKSTIEDADEKYKRMENTTKEADDRDSYQMEIESLELEMQKIHEESNSVDFKNDCKENIGNSNTDQINDTANDKIETNKSPNKTKPDEIKEIEIEVNIRKKVMDSNNLKDKIESSKKIKQATTPMDDETNSLTNTNESGHTSKLEFSGTVEANKTMVDIEIDTERNLNEELDDTFACSMMKMDSY